MTSSLHYVKHFIQIIANLYFMLFLSYDSIFYYIKTTESAMLCYRCGGTGRYMGNGMIMTDCKPCPILLKDQKESIKLADDSYKLDKRSKSYKDAIRDIMSLNDGVSKEEAVKMFDDAYEKV
jgi:hypothetical protein